MYNKIYDFCKVRNKGTCFFNGKETTPRVKFLIDLIESQSIDYQLHTFDDNFEAVTEEKTNEMFLDDFFNSKKKPSSNTKIARLRDMFGSGRVRMPGYGLPEYDPMELETVENHYFNIFLPGTSNRFVVAHHDVANASTDNANDNSASCINAIALKLLVPEINIILLDGEEPGGLGSKYASQQINSGKFGSVEWVLNLELTGKGGDLFFIGDYPGKLQNHILSLFDCPIFQTPFNDSVIFRKYKIDSTVINPLPPKAQTPRVEDVPPVGRNRQFGPPPSVFPSVIMNGQELDTTLLMNCHSPKDTVNTISTSDMKLFTESVLKKIVTS